MKTNKLYQFNLVCEKNIEYNVNDQINSSIDFFNLSSKIYKPNEIEVREYFYAIYLNNSNRIIGYSMISMGGITGTVVDVRILFREALLAGAVGLVLLHNHPSGKLKPSDADIKITKKIKEGSKILDIALLDHLIVSEYSYYSFADEGIL